MEIRIKSKKKCCLIKQKIKTLKLFKKLFIILIIILNINLIKSFFLNLKNKNIFFSLLENNLLLLKNLDF